MTLIVPALTHELLPLPRFSVAPSAVIDEPAALLQVPLSESV